MPLAFRARKRALLDAARAQGISPNPHAIAIALGLSEATVRRALDGGNPSAQTVLHLSYGLKVPVNQIFRVIDESD